MIERIILREYNFNLLTWPLLVDIILKNTYFSEKKLLIWPEKIPVKELRTELNRRTAIFFSFMTPHLPQIASDLQQLQKIPASHRPLLVAGGAHCSGSAQLALKIGFDCVFQGEAEESFAHFFKQLQQGALSEKVFVGRPASTGSFDRYFPFFSAIRRVPPLEIMRGCRWSCSYCQTASRRPLSRSVDAVAHYLQELARRNLKRVGFVAPSSLEAGLDKMKNNLSYLQQIFELSRKIGLKFIEYGIFPSEIRPETVNSEYLRLLKEYVSNRCLTIGAQSLFDFRLKAINRRHSVAQIEKALELAAQAGFKVNLDLIFAFPEESPAERQDLLETIRRWYKKYRVKFHLHHFFPLAGSRYEFYKPSFLLPEEQEKFQRLTADGIATDWWRDGQARARDYFDWLNEKFPDYLENYC